MSDYLARAARCATVNQFNHLHIHLDGTLAPPELAEIGRLSFAPNFPEHGRQWISLAKRRTPDLFETPQPFARRQITDRMIVYDGPEERRARRLLIAFTGVKRRMMISTPAFLQALDAREWDVVYLKWSNNFLDGVEGVADSLDGLVQQAMQATVGRRYAGVSTIGVSAGGPAAAIAALRLGARRGVSICGAAGERYLADEPARSLLRAIMSGPRLVFAYGAGFEPDRAAARAMARLWRGRLLAVPNVDGHNVMGRLLATRKLAPFLRSVL